MCAPYDVLHIGPMARQYWGNVVSTHVKSMLGRRSGMDREFNTSGPAAVIALTLKTLGKEDGAV